ncbi:MAG: hypothetical protein LBQ12_06125 [Deltaproteobacteria bacterium]|jgi:hypothetical protein|nr:hypothetical protein [Deltaproteobacteria bacterium]
MAELQVSRAVSLADRAGALHEKIREMTEELDVLKEELAPLAEFKNGSKTGHLSGNRYAVTVQLKENDKWDQKILDAVRIEMGDEKFFEVFKFTYEPLDKKTVDGAMKFGGHGASIRSAKTVTQGKPYVSFKAMEDC